MTASSTDKNSRLVGVMTLIVIAICCLVATALAVQLKKKSELDLACVFPKTSEWNSQLDTLLLKASRVPAQVRPSKRVPVKLNAVDVTRAVERLRLGRFPGLPILLHSAMVFGLDMEAPGCLSPDRTQTVKDVIFNHELGTEYFGNRPVFVETSWGLRNRTQVRRDQKWQSERQAHVGQLLAELAKQGVSLRQELMTEAGVFEVRDLVRDTVANYSPDEDQIEWICMALVLYLPPQKTWTDKFGHRFTFDDMADGVMERDFELPQLACHGIHLLEALALLLRVDAQQEVLSRPHRARLRRYLADHVAHLVKTQRAEGTWSSGWSIRRNATGQLPNEVRDEESLRHTRVHVTGHHLDWMLLLPADMMPPDDVFERAVPWLLDSLLAVSERDIIENYCPYSHAARVLAVLCSENSHWPLED